MDFFWYSSGDTSFRTVEQWIAYRAVQVFASRSLLLPYLFPLPNPTSYSSLERRIYNVKTNRSSHSSGKTRSRNFVDGRLADRIGRIIKRDAVCD